VFDVIRDFTGPEAQNAAFPRAYMKRASAGRNSAFLCVHGFEKSQLIGQMNFDNG